MRDEVSSKRASARSYEVIQSVSNMPTSFSGMSNLGLADSWYSAPAAGGLAYNVAPYDLATTSAFCARACRFCLRV